MNASQKSYELYLKVINRINLNGNHYARNQIAALRKAEMVLHRWFEHECNGDIQRDEETGKPYRVWFDSNWKEHRYPTADREKGALRTIKAVCEDLGLNYYIQQDPRGCALYVSDKPLQDDNYSYGVAICD